jgi:ADP-ribosylglycohydrolase
VLRLFVVSGSSRPDLASRIRGCLLGGAVGDALGAPVEFLKLDEIRAKFGAAGLKDFVPAYGRLGAITDDTQMTLFTAEGLLRAHVRQSLKGICHPPSVVHHAYYRWFETQQVKRVLSAEEASTLRRPDGWLVTHRELWSRRAPGRTCLAALSETPLQFGALAKNDSKGCGAIMRVAPVGLLCRSLAFDFGREVSAYTHGHPTGYLSGAYFAEVIALLVEGEALREAMEKARAPLERSADSGEVLRAIDAASDLARKVPEPAIGDVEVLGGGWVGEEALAIALYCALVATSFEQALRLSVNHSGDSDSTGSLAGNLLGVIHGAEVIPDRWLRHLELREVIEEVAGDLAAVRGGSFDAERQNNKYPGW